MDNVLVKQMEGQAMNKEQFFSVMNGQRIIFAVDRTIRVVNPFPVALGLSVSIQASYGHYCWPRETLDEFDGYESFEVYVSGHPYLEGRLNEYSDGSGVAAWVPVDELVQALNDYANHLKQMEG